MSKHKLSEADRWHRYCEWFESTGQWMDVDTWASVCPDQDHPEHGHHQRQAWPAVNMAGERCNYAGEVRPKGIHAAPE